MLRSQKVKELTYMHSEGIMAGELKHGPLALVDDSMPVIMIVMRDPVYVVSFMTTRLWGTIDSKLPKDTSISLFP